MICIHENELFHAIDKALSFHLKGKLGLTSSAKTTADLGDVARNVAQAVVMASESTTILPTGPIVRRRSSPDFYFLLFRGADDAIADLVISTSMTPAQTETLRTTASMLCRVLAGALDGEKTKDTSPEYAATAAARFVELLREMPRST